jgi:hypothetical protein
MGTIPCVVKNKNACRQDGHFCFRNVFLMSAATVLNRREMPVLPVPVGRIQRAGP